MKKTSDKGEPEGELQSFLERFDANHQKIFRSLRTALRKRFPTANELAYDYSHSVVIGYAPGERGNEAIVAIAVRDDGVFLYLLNGPQLPDPKQLLQGSAKQTRFIPIAAAARLRHPDVDALIDAAVDHAKVPLPAKGVGKLVIQSSAAKRRPRKKATK
ncbi:MAG TPA: hypothetical protein VG755_42300 [Nannocystaceae bacterium]|nr:hypothetical protein [Nannocystaceae bacterium]